MATKQAVITVRVLKSKKAVIVSEAKKDRRKLSQFCEILLDLGLRQHQATAQAVPSPETTA